MPEEQAPYEMANETMSAEEYRQKYDGEAQPQLDGLGSPANEHDFALAIDPGRSTGLAWTDGDRVVTGVSDWWDVWDALASLYTGAAFEASVPGVRNSSDLCVILEAPYKSRQSMGSEPAIAYNSGQVAREAELLAEWLRRYEIEYGLIEHDPAPQGPKWDSSFARKIFGDWEGPDNADVRDAIRLLFFYNFL
jgi:hypothetical protein